MNLKYKAISVATALMFCVAGVFTSCEDKGVNGGENSMVIESVVQSDALDTPLTELSSNTTIVVLGKGLSQVSEACFVDSLGNTYPIELNPAYVTNKSIIISLGETAQYDRTEKIRLTAMNGNVVEYMILKAPASPVIKQFYAEFVPEGDTLRVLGSAFLDFEEYPLQAWFFGEAGDTLYAQVEVGKNNDEIKMVVPEGVGDATPIGVRTRFGETESKILFRDNRNIFLDFDVLIAGNEHGALDTFSYDWSPEVLASPDIDKYQNVLAALGGAMPKGCNGYYAAITRTGDDFGFKPQEMIYYTQQSMDPAAAPKNLLGQFAGEALDNLVLKFEVYVPKEAPLAAWFYTVFSAYGTENTETCDVVYEYANCGYYSRDLTNSVGPGNFDKNTLTCSEPVGVPGAWVNMATLKNVDESAGNAEMGEAFYTKHGWMTVAVPLNSSTFRYDISSFNIVSSDDMRSCGQLTANDFYNFFLHCENSNGVQKAYNAKLGNGCDRYFFCGLDNFRIVPNDGGGVRFSKYYGATANSKYPY